MAEAGVARDPGRLPWLEPYRAPSRKESNRSTGAATAIGAAGLAAVLTLLMRDAPDFTAEEPATPHASVVLPAPADMQQPIVTGPLVAPELAAKPMVAPAATVHRAKVRVQRRIRVIPTRVAYRAVVKGQSGEPSKPVTLEPAVADTTMAIAALPLPPDPPRPVVNPAARVVRGKTVQLGVFRTPQQAEIAWHSAIRDYTYLVTMPKSIVAISIRSRRFYRLQLGTPSKQHARQLCSNLKSIGRACTVA